MYDEFQGVMNTYVKMAFSFVERRLGILGHKICDKNFDILENFWKGVNGLLELFSRKLISYETFC